MSTPLTSSVCCGQVDYLPKDLAQLFAEAYAADFPLDHPGLSPTFADLHGLPPLMVEVGECEVRQCQAQWVHMIEAFVRACAHTRV